MTLPPGREMARQLLERATAGVDGPAATAAAMQRLCNRVSANLRRSVGDDGYNAVLSRALARTEPQHPALRDMRHRDGGDIRLDGVAPSVATYGLPAAATALESLLTTLVDILTALIGADMVLNLIDHDDPSDSAPTNRQPS